MSVIAVFAPAPLPPVSEAGMPESEDVGSRKNMTIEDSGIGNDELAKSDSGTVANTYVSSCSVIFRLRRSVDRVVSPVDDDDDVDLGSWPWPCTCVGSCRLNCGMVVLASVLVAMLIEAGRCVRTVEWRRQWGFDFGVEVT